MPLKHWLQLSLTDGIGPILARRIIDATGSAEAACGASADLLATIEGIGVARSRKIATSLRGAGADAENEMARAAAIGVTIFCPDDQAYPLLLRSIPDPPNVLYCHGTLEPRDLNGFSIVGSRKCSFYGREQAERFGSLLAGGGFTVISGGARGVDSAAHRGAMMHPQGRTIAVLGSGVDVSYPPENKHLFEQIAAYGAVLSEYPLGTSPSKENFPRRNRIVSGMSRGVLIIEADVRSGALITARQAGEDHGRPVFALPGRVDNPLSSGPHLLIRDGATLTTSLEDILEGLGPLPQEAMETGLFDDVPADVPTGISPPPSAEKKADAPRDLEGLTDRQRTILEAMNHDSANADLIVERTNLPVQIILQELTFLSLKGKVKRVDGQTYQRR